jgi:hypothetical protein
MDDTPMQDTNAPPPPPGQLSEQAKVYIGRIGLRSRCILIARPASSRLSAEPPSVTRISGSYDLFFEYM